MSIIFNIFIEFIIILLLGFFYVFVFWGQGIWGLNSLSKYQTSTAPTALDKHFKDNKILY